MAVIAIALFMAHAANGSLLPSHLAMIISESYGMIEPLVYDGFGRRCMAIRAHSQIFAFLVGVDARGRYIRLHRCACKDHDNRYHTADKSY
jgi:hypothetical protein